MNYVTGEKVELGDIVSMPVPNGEAEFKVVMISGEKDYLVKDESFIKWVSFDRRLGEKEIVLEWTRENQLKHDDPNYAPVGDQMFTDVDQFVKLISKGGSHAI